jgi:hypothetical protein
METKKGDLKNFGFLSSNFMKFCRNIHPFFDSIMSIVVPNFAQIGGFLYFGGQLEFLTILKILKTKSTTLSDDLFLRQVSKGSAVRNEFKNYTILHSYH